MQNKTDDSFKRMQANIAKQLATLPKLLGNEMVNFALDNFARQGYQGAKFEKWPERKRKEKRKQPRHLLIKSGRLRRSIRIIRTTDNSVTVGTDVPYARAHNDGLTINRAARS